MNTTSNRKKCFSDRSLSRTIKVIKIVRQMAALPFELLLLLALYFSLTGSTFITSSVYGFEAFVVFLLLFVETHYIVAITLAVIIVVCNALLRIRINGIRAKDVDAFVRYSTKLSRIAGRIGRTYEGYLLADQGALALYNSKNEEVQRTSVENLHINKYTDR